MLLAALILTLLVGVGTAYAASYVPTYITILETCAGVLILGALLLLGMALCGLNTCL